MSPPETGRLRHVEIKVVIHARRGHGDRDCYDAYVDFVLGMRIPEGYRGKVSDPFYGANNTWRKWRLEVNGACQ